MSAACGTTRDENSSTRCNRVVPLVTLVGEFQGWSGISNRGGELAMAQE